MTDYIRFRDDKNGLIIEGPFKHVQSVLYFMSDKIYTRKEIYAMKKFFDKRNKELKVKS